MNEFIEKLKVRQQDAQRRMQAAQQQLAVAQAAFQAASQEFNSWNYAVAVEMQKAQQEAAAAQHAGTAAEQHQPVTESASINNMPEVNKTELVRAVLRQHANGITPVEIAKELKNQVDSAYIYSVLKRLKDRKQVTKKRGKYCLQQHQSAEEVAAQNGTGMVQH